MEPRTLIVSDPHGDPDRVLAPAEHVGFRPGTDRLLVAGDAVDGDPDAAGTLAAIARLGGTLLAGNHEAAHVFGLPQSPHDHGFDRAEGGALLRGLGAGFADGTHPLAAALAPDLLVTHAGLSELFCNHLATLGLLAGDEDAYGLAAALNRLLRDATGPERPDGRREPARSPAAERLLLSEDSPLDYRPFGNGPHDVPLRRIRQVAGHYPVGVLSRVLESDESARLMGQGFMGVDTSDRDGIAGYAMVSLRGVVTLGEAELR